MRATLALVLVLLAAPVRAEEPTPAWASHRPVADWVSTGLVGANLTLDTIQAWRAEHRKDALVKESLRVGLTIGVAELTKRLVHRERPDRSDDLSFFSEHTALAFASGGFNLSVSVPISLGAAYGRMAADKHHPSDVAVGAVVGLLANWFIR